MRDIGLQGVSAAKIRAAIGDEVAQARFYVSLWVAGLAHGAHASFSMR
jgi:hypothetical protein